LKEKGENSQKGMHRKGIDRKDGDTERRGRQRGKREKK
jgi:hypothetical protein